jgi:hypothetical protein
VSSPRLALVGLVALLALAAGTIVVGSALRGPAPLPIPPAPAMVVDPTSRPTPVLADTNPTPAPTATPPVLSFPDPSLTAVGVGVGPCAAMVQLLDGWAIYEPDPPVDLGLPPGGDDGYILMTDPSGSVAVLDGTSGAPRQPTRDGDGRIEAVAGYEGIPVARDGRIVPAPNGMAIAVEEGDLGVAGCGDPLVRFVHGGMLHPFTSRAFQAVTDLAWAHDGSALYGILRPTIDAAGKPLVTAPEDVEGFPGTVLRWDVTSRAVTDLGTPCPTCRLSDLAVAPDGRLLVRTADQKSWVRQLDGRWTDLSFDPTAGYVPRIIGWTPDGLAVVDGYDHIDTMDLNGRVVTTSGWICCHGNGYGGVLSPDGTHVVGSTLSNDFRSRDIVLIDVRDGTQQTIAQMPNPNGQGLKGTTSPRALPTVPKGSIVDWAPDGKSLLFLDQGPDGPTPTKLWALSLDTLTTSEPISVPRSYESFAVWLPRLP